MSWTNKDTEELRETEGTCEACIGSPMQTECSCIGRRAGDEIERLQARVAELEKERADVLDVVTRTTDRAGVYVNGRRTVDLEGTFWHLREYLSKTGEFARKARKGKK